MTSTLLLYRIWNIAIFLTISLFTGPLLIVVEKCAEKRLSGSLCWRIHSIMGKFKIWLLMKSRENYHGLNFSRICTL